MKRSIGANPIILSPGNHVYYGVSDSLGHAFAAGKEI